jgi:hypothetical protein
MRKPIVNYLLDWSAFLFLMPMIATGAILYFRLPPGSGTDSMLGPDPSRVGISALVGCGSATRCRGGAPDTSRSMDQDTDTWERRRSE